MSADSILGNVFERADLAGLARKRARPSDQETVKLADLVLPGRGPSMALRPALAILFEGLLIAALYAAVPRLLHRTA